MVRLQLQTLALGRDHYQQMSTVNHKTSKHLTRCTDPGCVLQLHKSIKAIMDVLNNANVTSELADIIETYLLNQGQQTMEDCIKPNSKYFHLSANIDNIGWDCFVEGRILYSLITVIKPMFCWCKPCVSIKIWGTKFVKSLISLTYKQWLYRNCDVHYISNGLTSRQHNKLTSEIKEIMKMKRTALLVGHRHYTNTNFNKLGHGPTLACQVWVVYMEMAISVAKVAKGNFCTQETLRQLRPPLAIPIIQHTPPITTLTNVHNTSPNPPQIYHEPVITLGAHARHASSSKTPYSKPCTNHRSSTPPHHPTLFPIFLRCHNTSKSKSPHQFFPLFYPAVAPQPYDKLYSPPLPTHPKESIDAPSGSSLI
jgi:hypothetical protein